jgi:hypothetical protein
MNDDDLACTIACQDVLGRLSWALDTGANSAAAELFTDDATLVTPAGELAGPAVREFMEGRSSAVATRHIMTNLVVNRTGPDTAEAISYLIVYRVPRDAAGPSRVLPPTPQAFGEWKINLRKTPAGWRLTRYEAVPMMAPAD